jgi:hypothetical protein
VIIFGVEPKYRPLNLCCHHKPRAICSLKADHTPARPTHRRQSQPVLVPGPPARAEVRPADSMLVEEST